MRLTISNIAWQPERADEVADSLSARGVENVEIAPTTRWSDPSTVSRADALEYREWWAGRGLRISSLQALLYGRPDLTILEDAERRDATLEYLSKICELGGWLGAKALVFGSPKNRLRRHLRHQTAVDIASEFFSKLAENATANGTTVCIEPNPVDYRADFILNAADAAEVVRQVDHPGVRLHLDTACMYLAGDPPGEAIRSNADILAHVHISEPQLGPVGVETQVPHGETAEALRAIGYAGFVSIEMRASADDELGAIARAVEFTSANYAG